jgi:hypothetical protein
MVLCYSRLMYLEFTVSQTLEHFLACHQHAFEAFHGVPSKIMIDNCNPNRGRGIFKWPTTIAVISRASNNPLTM